MTPKPKFGQRRAESHVKEIRPYKNKLFDGEERTEANKA
jgi:hypothetical protein